MSGISSNASAGSSGSSSSRPRYGRIVGVPLKCWCDEQTVGLISKSENNPYRRYFRCGYAASKKLMNDNHIFKWVDEALSNEIETLKFKNARLEQEMKEMKVMTERIMATDNKAFGTIQKELEKEIFDRFEVEMHEARCGMKKMMMLVVVVVVCLIMVVIKLVVA